MTFNSFLTNINSQILTPLISLLLVAAVATFFWGVLKYISNVSSDKDKDKGKDIMWWGIIALFVMVSVWGLVGILKNSFFDSEADTGTVVIPKSPSVSNPN